MCAAWIGLAGCVPLFAQPPDSGEKQLSCGNAGYDSQGARYCEVRELNAASVGRLNLDAGRNGGATIKGWPQGYVLVRAKVEAMGDNDAAARSMASQVIVDTSGGQVRASGPDSGNNSWWSVSYEVFVPQTTDLDLKAHNGGLNISDVRGQIHFDVTNGGVRLRHVGGDVAGATVNGGVQVELAGAMWDGRQLDVSTRNGGVTVTMPSNYSAHIQAETGMGGIQSDFPVTVTGNVRPRRLDFNVGSGGGLIKVTTGNGQVRFKRAETL
jgi:hypothetical protein